MRRECRYSQQNGETFEKPSSRVHEYFDRSALLHSQATTSLRDIWGAHAFCVLVKAFCLHELLSNCRAALMEAWSPCPVEVRRRKMLRPARYKRALPRTLTTPKHSCSAAGAASVRPLNFVTKSSSFAM